ncbi:MAG: FlaG family protein [Helicobacter sp.]|nr:FlaG family protein [Helicobacteraceae bacterium]MDY3114109.1 FlaG family protein [Helicobacter sp.]
MQINGVGTNFASMQTIANTQNNGNSTSGGTIGQPQTQTQKIEAETERISQNQELEAQKEKLNELAQQLNKELNPLNTSVTFSFSEDIQGLYVTVSEKDTNRVIRKIPSDEAMELMAKMKEVVGIIFNKQA